MLERLPPVGSACCASPAGGRFFRAATTSSKVCAPALEPIPTEHCMLAPIWSEQRRINSLPAPVWRAAKRCDSPQQLLIVGRRSTRAPCLRRLSDVLDRLVPAQAAVHRRGAAREGRVRVQDGWLAHQALGALLPFDRQRAQVVTVLRLSSSAWTRLRSAGTQWRGRSSVVNHTVYHYDWKVTLFVPLLHDRLLPPNTAR